MDEVRFQPYGSRCRMGVPPEVKDPVLRHHPTRKLCIHDVYFPNLEAVITAVEAQFAQWAQGNETLRRLCSI